MLLLSLLFIPLLGALGLMIFSKAEQLIAKKVALAFSGFNLLLFCYVLSVFQSGDTSTLAFNAPWLPNFGLSLNLALDGFSVLLAGLTCLLIPLIVLSTFNIKYDNASLFYGLILLTQVALLGVFMAQDIFLFYFFFEAALVPVYFLSIGWGGSNITKAAFKMFVYTVFGSLFMLVGLVYLYTKAQTGNMQAIMDSIEFLPATAQYLLFASFVLAFAIKMPLFPFHTWQANAYSESPTAATMLLGGLLSKMGVYGIIRLVLPFSPMGVKEYGLSVLAMGVIGLIYGSIVAVKQNNLKRLLAYSSFAHVGLMAAGIFSGTLEGMQGAMFQMMAHGINTVGLFFVVKVIFERTGVRSLESLGGLSQDAPRLSVYFMIILLGSVALPLTNGFVGEFLLLKGVFDSHTLLGALAGISIILGAVYMLRLFQKSMFGEKQDSGRTIKDVTGSESFVLLVISALVLIMGVFPNFILKISEPASEQLLEYLSQI
ncbi:MAG: NADH-quinone oxidoreductase subunit M [Algoriphagus sp.]|jgi:NADH-quinone oxidoreductase subunit M